MPDGISSVADLLAATGRGERVRYLHFWGHRPRADGQIGASCLSQWWPAEFTVDGLRFATAEHYMMWRKARLFGDTAIAERVLSAGHPKQAKDLGREVRDFDGTTWDGARFGIVVDGNTAKFAQHPHLRGFLLGTVGRVLVEASPLDRVWGIGLAADDPRADRPDEWRGLNLLGFALMRARTALAG